MFDKLFKHASTRARHVTAPFAEERARYLDYCELRGDSRSLQLRKAHDVLWIARKLNSHTELKVTTDQIRALVVNCPHYGFPVAMERNPELGITFLMSSLS